MMQFLPDNPKHRIALVACIMASMLAIVGLLQSWNVAFSLINLCLISAIMSLGLNIQWGYAGLVNFGVLGFVAIGGLSVVLISTPPVAEAWAVGGGSMLLAFAVLAVAVMSAIIFWRWSYARLPRHKNLRLLGMLAILGVGYLVLRAIADPAVAVIEAVNPSVTGYLGGLGLPILVSWLVAAALAGTVAMLIGRITLGLRADYLAIATLGIAEIIIYMIRNEEWLARGVKNVTDLPRPVPYEIDLKAQDWVIAIADRMGESVASVASLLVKLNYMALFIIVLAILFWMAEKAQRSPWGRMMRAIRDNEDAAEAMGKDVQKRRLQVFILGAAVIGLAGAMLTTLDGSFIPGTYQPLRFTFLTWIMVIVGGAGHNAGAVLGGFLIWFFWVESEPISLWLIGLMTAPMADDNWLKIQLISNAAQMRFMITGLVMLLVLRFAPKGLIPEAKRE